jgi:predicted nucleotidyltransferase
MDYWEHIHFKALVGSKAYGLDREESDDDWRGIYIPPSNHFFYLQSPPEQIQKTKDADETYWELKKFLQLALASNPNVLETLWSPGMEFPVLDTEEHMRSLVKIRREFLSKRIIKTYGGYAISQWGKGIQALDAGQHKQGWKHLMHLCRLLIAGTYVLKENDLLVDMSEYRNELLAIRDGKWGSVVVGEWQDELEALFKEAQKNTKLPDEPNRDIAEKYLLSTRRKLLPAIWKV